MRHSARLALTSGLFSYRALFAWNTPGLFIAVLIVTPLLQLVFFTLLGASLHYQQPIFFVLGNSIQVAASAGISGLVSVIADERRFGTLAVILASPASRIAVFVGRILPGVILGVAVSGFTSVLGLALLGWPIAGTRLWLLFVAIVIAAFSSATFGLFLSAVGLVYRDIFQIATAAYLLLLVVSGANIARGDLPFYLQWIGDVLPETHSIDAARVLASSSSVVTVWPSLGWEFGVGVCWLLVSVVGLRRLESRARNKSTLNLF